MNDIYFDILSTIITKSELEAFTAEIDRFIDSLFVTHETIDKKFNRHVSFDKREGLLALFKEQNIDIENPSSLKDFLLKIKEKFRSLPVLELTFAFHPQREFLERVSSWCMRAMGSKVILVPTVRQEIIGGITISYKGTYKDFSIKKLMDEKIEKNELSFV